MKRSEVPGNAWPGEDSRMLDVAAAARFRSLVAEKRVVVVGPSRSIIGSKQGEYVEAFDLVVRINHQWPVPDGLITDLGRRMDILYHCCNGDYPVSRLFVPEFQRTKFVCYEEGPDLPVLAARCASDGIDSMESTELYLNLAGPLGGHPNTGFVAITHLLDAPIAELYVTGFSFYREPYYEGYLGTGNKAEYWRAGDYPQKIWEHTPDSQLRLFKEITLRDRRVRMDTPLQNIVSLI